MWPTSASAPLPQIPSAQPPHPAWAHPSLPHSSVPRRAPTPGLPAMPTSSPAPPTTAPARLHTPYAAHTPTLLRLRAPNAVPSDTAVSCNMAGLSVPPRTVPRGLAIAQSLGQVQAGAAAMLGLTAVREGRERVGEMGGLGVEEGQAVGGGEGPWDGGGEAARPRKKKRKCLGGDDPGLPSSERSVRRRGQCRDKRTVEPRRPPPSWLVSTVPAVHPFPCPPTPPFPRRGSRDRSKAKLEPDAAGQKTRQPQPKPGRSGEDAGRPRSGAASVGEQEPQSSCTGRANSWGGAPVESNGWSVRAWQDSGEHLGERGGNAGVGFGVGMGGWEDLGRRRASEPVGLVSAAPGGGGRETHWGSFSVGAGDDGRRQSTVGSIASGWYNDGWSGDADVAGDPWADTFSFAAQVPSAPGSSHMSWDSSGGSVCDAEREMRGMVEEHRRASVQFLDPFAFAAPPPPAPISAPLAHSPSEHTTDPAAGPSHGHGHSPGQPLGDHASPVRRGWEHFTAPFASQVRPPPGFLALGTGPSPTSGGYAIPPPPSHPHPHPPHAQPHQQLQPRHQPQHQPYLFPSTSSFPQHLPRPSRAPPPSRPHANHTPNHNSNSAYNLALALNPNHNGLLPPSLLSRTHSPASSSIGPSSSVSTPEDPAAHSAQGKLCPVNMSDPLFAGNLPGEESFEKAFGMGWLRGVPGSVEAGAGGPMSSMRSQVGPR